MKKIKNLLISLFCTTLIVSTPKFSSAQEWTKEQKEVLQATETMFKYWANRDIEKYMTCLHDDFTGWFATDPLPLDKTSLQKWESFNLKNSKILEYEVKPVAITVSGDIGLIHYYLTVIREDDNVIKLVYSRWTDIYKKENDKWLNIGTHGIRMDK